MIRPPMIVLIYDFLVASSFEPIVTTESCQKISMSVWQNDHASLAHFQNLSSFAPLNPPAKIPSSRINRHDIVTDILSSV